MRGFVYSGMPHEVIFGTGSSSQIPDQFGKLGCRQALVLATSSQEAAARRLAASLGERAVGVFAKVAMHTPVEVTERVVEQVRASEADCTIALGGGSTIGLGKAIALRTDLPQIAVPTTYSGSEVTPILGETKDGQKTTQRTLKVLPEVVIYDAALTLGLPANVSASSGMNSIAHAVEALYAENANPFVSMMAEACIAAFSKALPAVIADGENLEARSEALYGAWLGGMCLSMAGMALHHKLCHVLGGAFDLPHAETHAVVLPHALAYNASAVPEAMSAITRALGAPDAIQGVVQLAEVIGVPRSLRELGMPKAAIDRAADLAVEGPYWNPQPLEPASIRELIARAWAGDRPESVS